MVLFLRREMLDMLVGYWWLFKKLAERLRIDQKQAQRENLKMKSLDPMLQFKCTQKVYVAAKRFNKAQMIRLLLRWNMEL